MRWTGGFATAVLAALVGAALLAPQVGAGSEKADLALTKADSPNTVALGGSLTYTVTVRNRGPGTATGVVVSDPLPVSTTFVSLVAPSGWVCTTPSVGGTGTVSCSQASLAEDASAAFVIVVRPTLAGTISNTASASAATADPNGDNDRDTEKTKVEAPGPCTVVGTNGNDVLVGTNAAHLVCGLAGNDTIFGLGGDDLLIGDTGADRLVGGSGEDRLLGGSGNDGLEGGPGRDRL